MAKKYNKGCQGGVKGVKGVKGTGQGDGVADTFDRLLQTVIFASATKPCNAYICELCINIF